MNKIKKGFTLIELLIVIAIIGILAGIVIVGIGDETGNASDKTAQFNLRQLGTVQAKKISGDPGYDLSNFCTEDDVETIINAVAAAYSPDESALKSTVTVGTGHAYVLAHNSSNQDVTVTDLATNSNDLKVGCFSSSAGGNNFVAWVHQRNETGTKHYCIDSSGFSGVTGTAHPQDIGTSDNAKCSVLFP